MSSINNIASAILALKQEYYREDEMTIQINKHLVKLIMREVGIPPADDWEPKDGERVGLLFGVQVFVSYSIDDFVVTAYHA